MTAGAIVGGTAFVWLIPLGCWLYINPEYQEQLWAVAPWLVVGAAIVKLLLAACVLPALRRRRLLEARALRRLLGLWLIVAVVLAGLLCWLIPANVAPRHLVAAGVVIALPMVRIALAPLALNWNRHR